MNDRDEARFRRTVARAFLFTGVGNALSKVINVVALLIAIKMVSEADFGIASLVLAIIAILRALSELSLGVALVQAKTLKDDEVHSLFWFSLLASGGFYALVFFAGAPALAWFYDKPELVPLVRIHAATILIFSFFFVSRTLMERDLHFGRMAIIDNIALTAASGLIIWLAYNDYGAWAFVLADAGFRVGQALLSVVVRPYLPRLRFHFRRIWNMVTFGMYASGSRLLYNFYINADYLIVGKFFSDEALGIYTFAYRVVADPISALATIVNQVSYPAFARLQDQLDRLRSYFFNIARLSMTLIGLMLICIAVFLDQVLLGFGFEKYLDAVSLAYVFAIIGTIRTVMPLIPQLLNAVGRPRLNFLYSLSCAIVLPAGFLIGAQLALAGVAVAWVIGYLIVVTLLIRFGAGALELPLGTMLRRMFVGVRVLLPLLAGALVFRSLLVEVLAAPSAVVGVVGPLTVLATGGFCAWYLNRDALALLKKTRETKYDEQPEAAVE